MPDYWVLDPLAVGLTAFQLDESGRYVPIGAVKGAEVFEARTPFAVRAVPAELLGKQG